MGKHHADISRCHAATPTSASSRAEPQRAALFGRPALLLDDESEVSEHPYGTSLPALEVTRAETLARCELIGCAQDCFRRVTASFPSDLIGRGRGEAMLREEPLRPQPVVVVYRAQYVSTGDVVPGHHVFIPPGSLCGRLRRE